MYRVYADGLTIYNDRLENLKIFSPSVDLELNKTGSFSFTIRPDHPNYGLIQKLKTIITVYQNDYLLFRGRVLDEEIGFHNEKKIVCEGDLAFFIDSIQRPHIFTGTIEAYLAKLIDAHNEQTDTEKRFTLGTVTVEGNVNIDEKEYTTTFDAIQKKLLDAFGGYVRTRQADGINYIDYLSEFNVLSPQEITLGENLLDLKRTRKGGDIGTALIPLGAKIKDANGNDTGGRLTIESVNGGSDTIKDGSGISQFRTIVKTAVFDDVTDPAELLKRGKAHLSEIVNRYDYIDLTAADMAATGKDIASFHIGTQVNVRSPPHGLNQRFLVSKLSIKLLSPAANKLTLGGIYEPFTAKLINTISQSGKNGKDGQDAVTLRIDSSRGTVFKNSAVSTELRAVIYKGGKTITDINALRAEFGSNAYLEWLWQRMGETTFGTILSTDKRIGNEGFSLLLNPSDVDTKVVFKCQLVTD